MGKDLECLETLHCTMLLSQCKISVLNLSLNAYTVPIFWLNICIFTPVQTKEQYLVDKCVKSGQLLLTISLLSNWYDSSIVYCCISSFVFWSLLRWLVQDVDIRSTWITNRKQVSQPVCHNIASMQDLNRRIRCSGRQNNLSHLYQVSRESVNCGSIGQSPICLS